LLSSSLGLFFQVLSQKSGNRRFRLFPPDNYVLESLVGSDWAETNHHIRLCCHCNLSSPGWFIERVLDIDNEVRTTVHVYSSLGEI
jgi:hypothetical protein